MDHADVDATRNVTSEDLLVAHKDDWDPVSNSLNSSANDIAGCIVPAHRIHSDGQCAADQSTVATSTILRPR